MPQARCFMSNWGDCDDSAPNYCPTLVVSLCKKHHEETHAGRSYETAPAPHYVSGEVENQFLCLRPKKVLVA